MTSGKAQGRAAALAAGLLGLLAGCAEKPAPPVHTPPPPAPRVVRPAPTPPPPPAPEDWRDVPLTPGDWSYASDSGGSQASFGLTGGPAAFLVRCERAARQVRLTRADTPGPILIRTSFGARSLAGGALPSSDPLLDQIAFSRGRFTVEAQGLPTQVIPAWPEPARVIEDCRS